MIPLAVLGGAMGLTAFGMLPVAIAFFAAATLMIVLGALSLREAYNAVQWPILVMLGALIPVSETIQTSGGADLRNQEPAQASVARPQVKLFVNGGEISGQ